MHISLKLDIIKWQSFDLNIVFFSKVIGDTFQPVMINNSPNDIDLILIKLLHLLLSITSQIHHVLTLECISETLLQQLNTPLVAIVLLVQEPHPLVYSIVTPNSTCHRCENIVKWPWHLAVNSVAVTQLLHQRVQLLLNHLVVKLHVDYHLQVVAHLLLVFVLSLSGVLKVRVGLVGGVDVGVVGVLLLLLLLLLLLGLLLTLSLFLTLLFAFDHLLLLPLLLLLQLFQLVLADSCLLSLSIQLLLLSQTLLNP